MLPGDPPVPRDAAGVGRARGDRPARPLGRGDRRRELRGAGRRPAAGPNRVERSRPGFSRRLVPLPPSRRRHPGGPLHARRRPRVTRARGAVVRHGGAGAARRTRRHEPLARRGCGLRDAGARVALRRSRGGRVLCARARVGASEERAARAHGRAPRSARRGRAVPGPGRARRHDRDGRARVARARREGTRRDVARQRHRRARARRSDTVADAEGGGQGDGEGGLELGQGRILLRSRRPARRFQGGPRGETRAGAAGSTIPAMGAGSASPPPRAPSGSTSPARSRLPSPARSPTMPYEPGREPTWGSA